MSCGKLVRLVGGYYYRIRRSRFPHECFYCRGVIPAKSYYVEEEIYMVERRIYHIECFKKIMGHRIRVSYSGGEPLLCLD